MHYTWLVTLSNKFILFATKYNLPIGFFIKITAFKQFCGGTSIKECENVVKTLGKFNVGSILDYSIEGSYDERALEHCCDQIKATIENSTGNPNIPFTVFKVTGLGSPLLLKKIDKGESFNAIEQEKLDHLRKRVYDICTLASKNKVRVFIDAEESWVQRPIDDFALKEMRTFNKKEAIVYNTYQLYRHDKLTSLKADIEDAKSKGYILGAKVVRGAYMNKERRRAAHYGYQSPIQPDKRSTDKDYNAALLHCVENIKHVSICAGTHNEESCLYLTEAMQQHKLPNNHPHIWFSQLYGMSDHLSFNLAEAGYNVAKYLPYGPVKQVIPYLIRRSEENTAIAGQMGRELSLIKAEVKRRRKNG